MFNKISIIFCKTPWYVFPIFAYILFIGIKATKDRVIFLPFNLVLPITLFALKVPAFFELRHCLIMYFFGSYLIGLLIGIFFGFKQQIVCSKNSLFVKLPGSFLTLIILLIYFCVRYFFGYLAAVNPALSNSLQFLNQAILGCVSGFLLGISIGYFLTWLKIRE